MSDVLTRSAVLAGPPVEGAYRAIAATGHPVRRIDARGVYYEVLDVDAPRLLESFIGKPVLDSHNGGSVRATLGTIRNAFRDGETIVIEFVLSDADDVAPIRQRIEDGTLKTVSAGYSVQRWKEEIDSTLGRVKTAVGWRAHEVSLVSVPADPNARIIRSMKGQDMTPEERARHRAEIRGLVRSAGLDTALADELIDADADLDTAKSRIFDAMQARPARPIIRVAGGGYEDPAVFRRAVTDALAYRAGGLTELPEAARPFMSYRIADIARACLEREGVSVRGMSDSDVLTRAAQTTADLPVIVQAVMHLVVLQSYKAAESALTPLFVRKLISDFKPQNMVRATGVGGLEPLAEEGEIRQAPLGEESESMQIATYARMVSLTRELLINDAVGALGDMVGVLGTAAAHTVNEAMAALLTNPPAMKDGNSPWHGESLLTAAALNDAGLSLARQTMRTRKGPEGKIIEAAPRYLVVGPELETTAEKLLSSITPHTTDAVNPWANLRLIVEPRITGRAWHLFADPARIPCLAVAYASFAEGPQFAREEGFSALATRWRCFLDFGVSWIDRRGAIKNPGT